MAGNEAKLRRGRGVSNGTRLKMAGRGGEVAARLLGHEGAESAQGSSVG